MTLPATPADLDIAVEATTQRQFRYSAATNTWTPYGRTDLFELGDIDTTLPSDPLDKLLWQNSVGKYSPMTTKDKGFVENICYEDTTRPPTSTDVEEVGTMWTYWDNQDENVYIASYTDPGLTETVWTQIGGNTAEWNRPLLPIQGTAPTSPVEGSLWFDNSGGPIVKKYWDGAAWQTLL